MRILTYSGNDKGKLYTELILGMLFIIILIIFLYNIPKNNVNFQKRRYIFIDGGAHIGETINGFLKSKLYSKHPWEIFAFEPNPYLVSHIPIKPKMVVLDKAIWIYDGEIDFYLAAYDGGASLLKEKKTGGLSRIPIRVKCVDFGQWIKHKFSKDDFIFVKLDIEGAEYMVLDKMLADGSIEYIDKLYIEFHNIKVNIPEEKDRELIKKIEKLGIPVLHIFNEPPGIWKKWFDSK